MLAGLEQDDGADGEDDQDENTELWTLSHPSVTPGGHTVTGAWEGGAPGGGRERSLKISLLGCFK